MNTILIVEDDVILRDNMKDLLLNEGYKVLVAENGLKAYQEAIKHIPDLIVSDIHMPYMDGYELMTILRNDSKTKYTPFIFITADIEKPKMAEALSKGAREYITKPFDLDELLEKIKKVVSINQIPELKIKRNN